MLAHTPVHYSQAIPKTPGSLCLLCMPIREDHLVKGVDVVVDQAGDVRDVLDVAQLAKSDRTGQKCWEIYQRQGRSTHQSQLK